MEYTQTSADLSCPCCHRDYEVPRRFRIHKEDFDFCPLPRLLPCLHSACHSCLQDQFERSTDGSVSCYICKHREGIQGVGYLPFDFNVLKQIVALTSSEIMAVCARCYDPVPSMSYCLSCSSALCEFHHQDHRLSVDTAKHTVYTFQEAIYQKKHLVYRFPPMPCPEEVFSDCSIFCQTCNMLLSPRAGLLRHQSHTLSPYLSVVDEMARVIQQAIDRGHQDIQRVKKEMSNMKRLISALDKREEIGVQAINKTFSTIINQLKQRQKHLTAQFTGRLQDERHRCLKIFKDLQDKLDDLTFAEHLAKALLVNTHTVPTAASTAPSQSKSSLTPAEEDYCSSCSDPEMEGLHAEKMYMVAAAETIDFRIEALVEETRAFLAKTVHSNEEDQHGSKESKEGNPEDEELMHRFAISIPQVQFLVEDATTYSALSQTFGYLIEGPPFPASASVARQSSEESSEKLFFALHIGSGNDDTSAAEPPRPPEPPRKQQGHGKALPVQPHAPATSSQRQTLVIEARSLTMMPAADHVQTDTEKGSLLSKWRAPLMGKVVLIDETEAAVAASVRWKCHYDARVDGGLPVLTIHKELVSSKRRG